MRKMMVMMVVVMMVVVVVSVLMTNAELTFDGFGFLDGFLDGLAPPGARGSRVPGSLGLFLASRLNIF